MRFKIISILVIFSFLKMEGSQEPSIITSTIVKVRSSNSNFKFVQSLFPNLEINQNTKLFNTWLVQFLDSIPYNYLKELKQRGIIDGFTVNSKLSPRTTIPNDPKFKDQFYHTNILHPKYSIPYGINSVDAWDFNKNSTTNNGDTIVVAILDHGFDINHEDLNYFTNYSEIDNDSIDNDNNGAIDDYKGWNAYKNNNYTNGAGQLHGTFVSGRIAAKGNNNIGVTGVAWNCKILPIAEVTYLETMFKAVEYIVQLKKAYLKSSGKQGAYITAMNFSLGREGRYLEDDIWCATFDTLGSVGIITVVAVANIQQDVESYEDMPVSCNNPNMINVTACDTQNIGLSGSGYSKKYVHLAAPNTFFSTRPGNNYGLATPGASFSAPLVAGAIALMYSNFNKEILDSINQNPLSMISKIKNIILKSVDTSPNLKNFVQSEGKLNLYKSVSYVTNHFNPKKCIDKTIKQSHNTLIAIQDSVSYQWYYCNPWRIITNETKKTFTTTTKGSYAVVLDNGKGCRDTSDCIALNNSGFASTLNSINRIYPIPFTSNLTIDLDNYHKEVNIKIYDLTGRQILNNNYFNSKTIELDLKEISKGTYYLHIETENSSQFYNILKD